MADSADLWTAIGAAIDAESTEPLRVDGSSIFVPGWPRFYRGQTHARTINGVSTLPTPGYILLKQDFEDEAGAYNGEGGQATLVRLGCWALTPDDARRLYRWLKMVLHEVPLTVPGYQPVWGSLGKSGPTPDADGTAWQMEASYRAEPMELVA